MISYDIIWNHMICDIIGSVMMCYDTIGYTMIQNDVIWNGTI